MRLVVSKSPAAEWGNWLRELDGNIFHSEEWAETNRSERSQPLYFRWIDQDGRPLGQAIGIERWSPTHLVGRFSKHLQMESYPAVAANDAALARSMVLQVLQFARGKGFMGLTLNSYGAAVALPELEQLGFEIESRFEFVLDLTLTDDELWHNLSQHHRRKIKKSGQHELKFEEADTLDAIQQLRLLQKNSRERRIRRGESMELLDDSHFFETGKRYFEKHIGRVFMLTDQGQPVTAAFVTIYSGRAFYVWGGSSDTGFEMNAPALLFWKILPRCRELGCREFNLGGVPAEAAEPAALSHGLFRFKAGFGGRQVNCFSGVVKGLQPGLGLLVKMAKRVLHGQI